MFSLETTKDPSVLEIGFDYWDCIDPLGPFWDIVRCYGDESEIMPMTVDRYYNYKFTEDDYKIQFYWNAVARIYIFCIARAQYQMVYDRLKKICTDLNRQIAEKKYLEKYGELPNHGKGFISDT